MLESKEEGKMLVTEVAPHHVCFRDDKRRIWLNRWPDVERLVALTPERNPIEAPCVVCSETVHVTKECHWVHSLRGSDAELYAHEHCVEAKA